MRPLYAKELGLTTAEQEVVERYLAWRERRRRDGILAKFYVEIDRQYPELHPDVREELAESMYRKQQSEHALKRSYPRTAE